MGFHERSKLLNIQGSIKTIGENIAVFQTILLKHTLRYRPCPAVKKAFKKTLILSPCGDYRDTLRQEVFHETSRLVFLWLFFSNSTLELLLCIKYFFNKTLKLFSTFKKLKLKNINSLTIFKVIQWKFCKNFEIS